MAIFRTLYYFLAVSALFLAFSKIGWLILLTQDFGVSLVLMALFSSVCSTAVYVITTIQEELRSNRIVRMLATVVALFLASAVPVVVLYLLSLFSTAYISLPLPLIDGLSKIWGTTFATVWIGWFIVGLIVSRFSSAEDDDLAVEPSTEIAREKQAKEKPAKPVPAKQTPAKKTDVNSNSRDRQDAEQDLPEWILLWALARKRIDEGKTFSGNNLLLESLALLEKDFESTGVTSLEDLFKLTYELALNQMRLDQYDLAKYSLERALSLRQRLSDSVAKVPFAEMMRKLDECRMRVRGENQTN